MDGYLIPFKGRNKTGPYNLNFLWKTKNIYIMDNHRAALWCWMQHITNSKKYNLLHMDQHYDTMASQLEKWLQNFPDVKSMTIEEYLEFKYEDANFSKTYYPLFRFDTYLTIFLAKYSHLLNIKRFLTHKEGDIPKVEVSELEYYDIVGNLDYWLNSDKENHIINIDLDFFFREVNGKDIQIFSNDYITHLASSLNKVLKKNKIEVMTIALSPEFCNGWEKCEEVLEIFLKPFKLNFTLE